MLVGFKRRRQPNRLRFCATIIFVRNRTHVVKCMNRHCRDYRGHCRPGERGAPHAPVKRILDGDRWLRGGHHDMATEEKERKRQETERPQTQKEFYIRHNVTWKAMRGLEAIIYCKFFFVRFTQQGTVLAGARRLLYSFKYTMWSGREVMPHRQNTFWKESFRTPYLQVSASNWIE